MSPAADRLTRAERAREDVPPSTPAPLPAGWWDGPGAAHVPPRLAEELRELRRRLGEWRFAT
jgi:hypothetical protein